MTWPFSKPKAETDKDDEVSRGGVFSTDMDLADRPRKGSGIAKAQAMSIQVIPTLDTFHVSDGRDAKAVFDSDFGSDFGDDFDSSIKRNFRLNQSGMSEALIAWYGAQGFIGYQMMSIIAQNWLVDKACTVPARDAVRKGYEITSNDGNEITPEAIDDMRKADKAFRINDHCEDLIRKGNIFGIRLALFVVDTNDKTYYEKPFNIDAVKKNSYKGIVQIDPYWLAPELDMDGLSDPASLNFYEPMYWTINGRRIHRSHFAIMRTSEPTDLLKPTYRYGGISLTQRIYERVYAAERTANEAPLLAMTKRTTVLKLDLVAAAAAGVDFLKKLGDWIFMRDNQGVKVIGGDEEMQQFDTSLADLDDVIQSQYMIVSSISNVPVTKLMGTSAKGLNATGEGDESNYHEYLESIQTHDLTPFLERHHALLIASEIGPKHGMKPFSTTVQWLPLDAPSAKEQAETNKIKADTGKVLVDSGAIDPTEERKRVVNDPSSGYSGLPEEIPENEIDPDIDPDTGEVIGEGSETEEDSDKGAAE